VILHRKIESRKVPVWLKKMVLAQHNCIVCGGWYMAQQCCDQTADQKQVFLMGTNVMIGPGGLLLVVPPRIFGVPVSVLWVKLEKSE
jgi:hypothetical protein